MKKKKIMMTTMTMKIKTGQIKSSNQVY